MEDNEQRSDDRMSSGVLIMLATYNGQSYIRQQIDSIIAQDYSNWHLIIQDDGSKDDTRSIVEEYAKKDSRIELCLNESGKHGAFYNFHSLANRCKKIQAYEYYMFCDQDDLWKKDKIRKMISSISKVRSDIPALGYADMEIIDANNGVTSKSINQQLGLAYHNKYSVFFSHNVFGCNIIMNRALFMAVPILDTNQEKIRILSHDNLYTKFAAALGQIIYIPEVMMSYRRHGENVTSKQSYSFDFRRILARISAFKELVRDHALTYNQSLMAIQLLRQCGAEKQMLDEIEHTIVHGGLPAVFFVIKHHISWGKPIKSISRITVLLLGTYRQFLIQDIAM